MNYVQRALLARRINLHPARHIARNHLSWTLMALFGHPSKAKGYPLSHVQGQRAKSLHFAYTRKECMPPSVMLYLLAEPCSKLSKMYLSAFHRTQFHCLTKRRFRTFL